MKTNEIKTQTEIYDTLLKLSAPPHMPGFGYLATAIELAVAEPDYISSGTRKLYVEVARQNNVKPQNVEVSIRQTIEAAKNRDGMSEFGEYFDGLTNPETGRPTNLVFISTVAERVREKEEAGE